MPIRHQRKLFPQPKRPYPQRFDYAMDWLLLNPEKSYRGTARVGEFSEYARAVIHELLTAHAHKT